MYSFLLEITTNERADIVDSLERLILKRAR